MEYRFDRLIKAIKKDLLLLLLKQLILYILGGTIYYFIEIEWRGYSYPAMFHLGGLCFLLIDGLNEFYSWKMPLILQMTISAGMVTLAELIVGSIGLALGIRWWDYSDMWMNYKGLICPQYTFYWFWLSLPTILLGDGTRWLFFKEKFEKYKYFCSRF